MDRLLAIELFIRVVDLGSFSKAAADLGMGQPTATKLVASLEKRLGSRLLHRSTHGVTPTEIGALYYEKCKLITHHVEDADSVAALMQSAVVGGSYLAARGLPLQPADLQTHDALIYSTVQGDARWHLTGSEGVVQTIPVKGPLRSNNLSALLVAARGGMGLAALPLYVACQSVSSGALRAVLTDWTLPSQEIHAVYPSPQLVPAKVTEFVSWLQGQFGASWWAEQK